MLPKEEWTRTRVGLGRDSRPFDWDATFGRAARRVVDLGCGNGRYLIHSGLLRRELDHLGIELVPPALRLGSLRAGQRGLTNVKFAWGDANEFICERAVPASIDEVHLYHPQPYYEESKLDRRQLTPRTLLAIWRALRPDGVFVFQTDNPAYMSYARRCVSMLFAWGERFDPWPDAPEGRTLREMNARAQGLTIFRSESRRLEIDEARAVELAGGMGEPSFDANKPGFESRGPRRAPRGGRSKRHRPR